MKSPRKPLHAFTLGIILLVGSITLINFLINIKAMFLLRSAFVVNTDWASDFQRITRWMLAKVLSPDDWNNPNFTDIDFFKLTSLYVTQNNKLVLWLSLAEIMAVNALRSLRQMATLRQAVSIIFGTVMVATFLVSRLSESFGGF